jgi:hypothetical protein
MTRPASRSPHSLHSRRRSETPSADTRTRDVRSQRKQREAGAGQCIPLQVRKDVEPLAPEERPEHGVRKRNTRLKHRLLSTSLPRSEGPEPRVKTKFSRGKLRNLVSCDRRVILALMFLSACAEESAPAPVRKPWDQWTRPGATEEDRQADYAQCAGTARAQHNEAALQSCMIVKGWQLSDRPGSADRL